MGTINIVGTGGIIEGNLGTANVNVNLDSALLFDGVNDSIDCNDVSTLDGATDITLTCWIKPVALSGTDYFLSKEVDGSNKIGIAWDSDLLYFQVADDANAYGTCAFDDATYNGVWTHLALVFDGGATGNANRLKAYINGVEQTLSFTGTIPAQTDSNSADFLMAKFSSNYYNGYMADVKIYNTNLGQTDIQTLASKINYPDILSTGTRHWWKINEGTGTAIEDHGAATDFDGTVTGATWKYDTYSVDVYDNSTTTDGTFTVTQGKVEGLALTSAEFDNATDYINLGNHNEFNFGNGSSDSPFTFAGWIRVDDATSGAIFSVYNEYAFGLNASDKLYLDLYDNADNVYERQSSTNTLTSYENEWVHVAATYSGVGGTSANAGINLYVNGVAIAMTAGDSGTYTAMHNLSNDAYIGYLYGAAGDAFDGEIGEFRIYDQELSAEQIASLYSKTLAFTPSHLYRLDEGSETTANDTGTATTRNGTLINDTTWNNGTLDLDRGLEIAANGVMSAPRGTLKISLDTGTYVVRNISTVALPNNGSDAAVTGFAHNDGTVELGLGSYGHNQQIGNDASHSITFYNLDVLDSWYDTRGTVYVENVLDLSSYRLRLGVGTTAANYIIGKASATSQSTESKAAGLNTGGYITGGGGFSMGSSAVSSTIQGASTLYPAILNLDGSGGNNFAFGVAASQTAYQPTNSSYPLQLSNLELSDAWTTVDVGVPLYYKLTGDMKFAAVTLADEINLDCDTHDITTSGTLTVEGTFTGGSGLHNINSINANNSTGSLTLTSGITFLNGGGSSCFGLASGLSDLSFAQGTLVFNQSDGNQRFEFNRAPSSNAKRMGRVVFNNGSSNAAYIGAVAWTSSTRVPTGDIIVASTDTSGDGFLTQNLNMSTDGNMTIATGAKLSAGSSELTVAGDFTTSGGLIGKSALNLTGSEEVTGTDNLDEVATSNRVTVEAWFKATTDANYRAIFSRGTSWSTGNIYMYMNSTGNVQFSMNDLGATVTSTTAGLADGKWHHAAATYDQTNLKLYIDGKLEASSAYTNPINTQTNGFKIGDRDGDNWVGQIGRVSIWDAALTPSQIREMLFYDFATADSEATIPDANCIGWWQFDKGSSTAVADSSTNNADGTLNSAAWAGSGALSTVSTSTLNMSGTNKFITYNNANLDIGSLNVTGTITLKDLDGNGSSLRITGNTFTCGSGATLSSDSSEKLRFMNGMDAGTVTFADPATNVVGLSVVLNEMNTPRSLNIPAVSFFSFRQNGTGTTIATGNHTFTSELEINNGTYNANGKTITSKLVDINGTGTFTLGASGLVLNNTSGGLTSESGVTLNAGPGCTIGGDASGQKVSFQSQNSFQIVGDIDDLNVTNEELTVVGTVSNCTGNILQFTPGHDTTLSLETDTAEDRDIRLGGPSLDNANHLIAE